MFPSRRFLTRKNFLIIFALWLLCLAAFQFMFIQLKNVCGLNTILDLYFHYNSTEAMTLLTDYGSAGREIYQWTIFLDMVYPLVYGLLFWMSFTYLGERIHLHKRFIKILQTLPYFAVVSDYLENVFELWMTLGFPDSVQQAASIGGWITTLKWIFVYTNFLVLIFLVIIFIFGMNLRED